MYNWHINGEFSGIFLAFDSSLCQNSDGHGQQRSARVQGCIDRGGLKGPGSKKNVVEDQHHLKNAWRH